MTVLLPLKATFAPGEPVEIEVRDAMADIEVSLWRLDELVATAVVRAGETTARFDPQPEGGYGVEAGDASTALDVLADPLARARYGFVASYDSGKDVAAVSDNVRRLHLNAVQFYDWMYRHADLLPAQDEFVDALGRPISLGVVRALATACRAAGSLPLGYAAVYAAGRDEWPSWQDEGLYRANGEPWMLGDFLWNVDPSSDRWVDHFGDDLERAVAAVGFAGFHLDQYGAPKRALRADGSVVDLAAVFPTLIERLAARLPKARLIFNNVNDFPTWSTATAPQAAVYVEVWSPNDRLADIARLIASARSLAPGRSVILAAYLGTFAKADEEAASAAQQLLLATAFSHGASVLLHGESQGVLTEAYYVTHGRMSDASLEHARRLYDFAVRYGDLLFASNAVDVTRTHLGGVNEEIVVHASVPVTVEPVAGALWARAVRAGDDLVVHLIDLSRQRDDLWDAPKHPCPAFRGLRVAVERVGRAPATFATASPGRPSLHGLEPSFDGRYDMVEVPEFTTWAIVRVRDGEAL